MGDAPLDHRRPTLRTATRSAQRAAARRLTRKRLFEVSVWDETDPRAGTKTLIALADDESDLCNLEAFDTAEIVTVVQLPGQIASSGPSRIIGSTRSLWKHVGRG